MSGFGLGSVMQIWAKPGKFSTMELVKNQDINARQNQLLTDWDKTRAQGERSLADFTSQFYKNEPTFRQQETGAVSRYYNGEMERQLASQRASEAAAQRAAADRALNYALRDRNSALLLGGGGGGSSYNTRLGLRQASDIETALAMQQANQARADLNALEQAKLGLIGQRTGIMQRSLLPYQLSQGVYGANLGNLGQLTAIDQANKFYGVQRTPSNMERWGKTFDAIDEGIMNMASTASSVMGMAGGMGGLGGGGKTQSAPSYSPASELNWMPSGNGFGPAGGSIYAPAVDTRPRTGLGDYQQSMWG